MTDSFELSLEIKTPWNLTDTELNLLVKVLTKAHHGQAVPLQLYFTLRPSEQFLNSGYVQFHTAAHEIQ